MHYEFVNQTNKTIQLLPSFLDKKGINYSISLLRLYNINYHQYDGTQYNFLLVSCKPYIAIKI